MVVDAFATPASKSDQEETQGLSSLLARLRSRVVADNLRSALS